MSGGAGTSKERGVDVMWGAIRAAFEHDRNMTRLRCVIKPPLKEDRDRVLRIALGLLQTELIMGRTLDDIEKGKNMSGHIEAMEKARHQAIADEKRLDWLQTKCCGIGWLEYGDYEDYHDPDEGGSIRGLIDAMMVLEIERAENDSKA